MERRVLSVLGSLLVLIVIIHPARLEESVDSLVDVLSPQDRTRLEQVLYDAQPYNTVKDAYLIMKGIKALGLTVKNKQNLVDSACRFIIAKIPQELEEFFYTTSGAKTFDSICKHSLSDRMRSSVQTALKGTVDTKTLYHAVSIMHNMDMPIPNDTLPAALIEAVESEDTPQSYAYAFMTAPLIPGMDLSVLFDHIEDIVAQADETSSTLYFEGGIKVTSDVINGIFALADHIGLKPVITETQATKFGNFLMASKYTSTLEDAVNMLTAATTLSTNQYVVPVGLLTDNTRPISATNQDLSLRLTTLMGGAVEGFNVKVKSLEDPKDEVNPRTRIMTKGTDNITFSYPMYKDTTGPGRYRLTVSTESEAASPAVKLTSIELPVMVSFQVAVSSAKLSIVDKDQGITTKVVSLDYPNTSKTLLQADQHSKVVMTFTLTNQGTSTPVTVHQAFVRLTLDKQEIFFVATPNDEKQYSFELDVAESANDFGQLSGTYSISMVVGDFALENPLSWNIASVELKFPGTPVEKVEDTTHSPKLLIEHLFRVPEKRPPLFVSSAFTVLIILPLVFLLIVWLVMGANFSDIMNGGLWSLPFHIGLGAILFLYYKFWTQLNMFTTLKYLVVIGAFTFFTGNRMLRNIAKTKQS